MLIKNAKSGRIKERFFKRCILARSCFLDSSHSVSGVLLPDTAFFRRFQGSPFAFVNSHNSEFIIFIKILFPTSIKTFPFCDIIIITDNFVNFD